ncbi:hypothetical protein XA68_16389 [Ophiocordyceps unilateralis]|uniref:Uncharacterized protein n=1 Tax=Ophiocordyceps unilateralis TaxID=268505 RepID=A0A2A9P519_OPHUN|nr:hypothetical protein XA68_16389 [Ophiocordyceps unilateralis]
MRATAPSIELELEMQEKELEIVEERSNVLVSEAVTVMRKFQDEQEAMKAKKDGKTAGTSGAKEKAKTVPESFNSEEKSKALPDNATLVFDFLPLYCRPFHLPGDFDGCRLKCPCYEIKDDKFRQLHHQRKSPC